MKKVLYLLILGAGCFGYESYADPPPTRTKPVAFDEMLASISADLQSSCDHLLQMVAVLPNNDIDFGQLSYEMEWTIGTPTGQKHEEDIYASACTRAGIHRMRNSK